MPQPNVLRKVKVDGIWLLLPVSKVNGKIDWTKLDYKGEQIPSVEGTFYLDYREKGRRIRRAVGNHPMQAKRAIAVQGRVLELRDAGMDVDDAPEIQAYQKAEGPKVADVIQQFVTNPPVKLRKKSQAKYSNALREFGRWTRKTYMSQLDRSDINNFMSHLVNAQRLDPSTAFDKGNIVLSVMRDQGADIRMKKGDWPRATEREVEVYEPDVLKALFAAMKPEEYELYQTFLLTGFREQEVGYLAWDDFNPRKNTLSVTAKSALGFLPKNYQERTIPVHDVLVDILEKRRKRTGGREYLIFPTGTRNKIHGRPGGQRDKHMLHKLKTIALRAGLNCGHCASTYLKRSASCAKAPICTKFGLHKFRHTYATTMLRDGVDLRSLQDLLGHKDLDSTRKYLRALQPADLLEKIRGTSIAYRFSAPASGSHE